MPDPQHRSRSSLTPTPTPAAPLRSPVGGQTGISNQLLASPFRLSQGQLADVLAQSERPLRAWLDQNRDRVQGLSLRAAAYELRRGLPAAAEQGQAYCEAIVRSWAAERGLRLGPLSIVPHPADQAMPSPPPGPPLSDNAIARAVSSILNIAIGGVGVVRPHGYARVSASGSTVGLRRGGLEAAGTVSWSGDLGLQAQAGNVHFQASIGRESWTMSLTFPNENMPADTSRLSAVFGEAEAVMRDVLTEFGPVPDPARIPDLAERVRPHTRQLRAAVDAMSSIAQTRPGVSFGIQAEGPGLGATPGAPNVPAGTSIQAVVTIVF